jgi:outer membrane beta-barrel protein
MDIRFQHLLLTVRVTIRAAVHVAVLFCASISSVVCAEDKSSGKGLSLDNEVFELGAFIGIVNIEDFTSEMAPGLSLTFKASEDFFIQYNYLQISDVDLSLYESQDAAPVYFTGKGREFTHYDLLVGYNIFQGEIFKSNAKTTLSTLFVVLGAGETQFGEESRFSYTFGLGYQLGLTKRCNFNVDFRNYIYDSSVILDQDKTVNTTQISSGVSYIF